MTDNFADAPDEEFIDLTAVDLIVETTLYPIGCDELDTVMLTAGAEPFILLQMAQVPGENTLAYQIAGSMIDHEQDVLTTLESFVEALRAKIESSTEVVDGEVIDTEDIEPIAEALRASEDPDFTGDADA